jgi:capsular polysaccharide transport system permease protein
MSGIDDATAALKAGNYDEASQILETLGAGKPGAAVRNRAFWAIAQVLRRNLGRETVEAILEVARRVPSRGEPIFRKLQLAAGPLDALLSADAAQEVRLRIGDYFLRANKGEEAMPWLSAALAEAPEDPIAIYLEANCRFVLHGGRQAIRDMEGALEDAAADKKRAQLVGGRVAGLWYRIGVAHDKTKNPEDAARYLAKAVELDPRNNAPRVVLGGVLIRLGRFEEAIERLTAIDKFSGSYRYAARLRAIALFRIGETEQALALLREVAEIDPLAAINFLEIGRIHLACGDSVQAEVALARAFRTNPKLPGLKPAIVTLEGQLGRHMDPDAGLPTTAEFTIPEEFAAQPDSRALYERPKLAAGWRAGLRVLEALIVRDVLVVYSRNGMGYLWALAHPLAYMATIGAVYIMLGHRAPAGISMPGYLATGIVAYINFYVRIQGAVSNAVRGNISLLYFRSVTPLALVGAAFLREFLTSLVVFVIVVVGIAVYEDSWEIDDPLTILAALTGMGLLGMIVGAFFGLAELAVPAIKLGEIVLARAMLFFSGVLFFANMLPARIREWALLNPMLHLIEFVRDGYFVAYHSRYVNWEYPVSFIVAGLALTMVLLHATRRYMVPT